MTYRETAPPPLLRPWIRVIWELELPDSRAFGSPLRIVPDGAFELVVHFGAPFRMRRAGEAESLQPASFLISQTARFAEIRPSGASGMMGVRFHPWGIAAFLRGAVEPYADQMVGAPVIWGRDAADLEEQLAEAGSSAQRFGLVRRFLLRRLRVAGDPLIEAGVRAAWRDPARSVPEMAAQLGASERSLQRRFRRDLGMSPKRCLRIARFLHACESLRAGSGTPLAETALAHGYYDQSHLIGEFQSLAGMTPGAFACSPGVAYLRVSGA